MTRQMRPITRSDLTTISVAIRYARDARTMLRKAGADKAADYMARAIKSAEGAQRHAERTQPEYGACEDCVRRGHECLGTEWCEACDVHLCEGCHMKHRSTEHDA